MRGEDIEAINVSKILPHISYNSGGGYGYFLELHISAYLKNFCLKLNFDNDVNKRCHPFFIQHNFTLNNKIIYLALQNWCSKQSY